MAAPPGSGHHPFGGGLVPSSQQDPSHALEMTLAALGLLLASPAASCPHGCRSLGFGTWGDWKRFPQEPKHTWSHPGGVTKCHPHLSPPQLPLELLHTHHRANQVVSDTPGRACGTPQTLRSLAGSHDPSEKHLTSGGDTFQTPPAVSVAVSGRGTSGSGVSPTPGGSPGLLLPAANICAPPQNFATCFGDSKLSPPIHRQRS